MKFNTSLSSVLLALAALTQAVPAPNALPDGFEPISPEEVRRRMAEPESSIAKRTPGGIYLCTGEGYSGTCGYAVQPVCGSGQCNTASSIAQHCVILTSPYLRNIGSFGPDSGATVYLSNNGSCNEAVASISYPGSGTFFEYSGGIGHQITSFLVFAN